MKMSLRKVSVRREGAFCKINMQFGAERAVRPGQAQLGVAGAINPTLCGFGKGRAGVSHAQKRQLLLNHGSLKRQLGLLAGQIGTVDFLMSRRAAAQNGVMVVLPRQQIQIPYLRLSRHKQLNRARQQQLPFLRPQGAVIGGIHLIIDILLAMQILHHSAAADH